MDAAIGIQSQRELGQSRSGSFSRRSNLAVGIARLPKIDQLMLQLLLIDNLTDAAVADILDVDEADVERASVRVLKRLQLI